MTHWGIDISNHQGNFDFAAAKREGFTWATHKVTEADWFLDKHWARALDQMREHFPGRFGGYVFCRTNVDPNVEADFLAKHMPRDVPLQIDYEDTANGGSGEDLFRRVRAYQERGFHLLPIYLPRWFWEGRMGRPDLSGLPVNIWNSHYLLGTGFASALYERHPALNEAWADMGGKKVEILQFTEKALVAGQLIDANIFRGSDEELDRLFNVRKEPAVANKTPAELVLEQLAGLDIGDGHRGWPQLGGRSLVDAVAVILTQLVGKDPTKFEGWTQLGGRTLVDGVAKVLANQLVIDQKLNQILDILEDKA